MLITPVAIFLAWASAGAGHGDYVFARLFFPYSMLLTRTCGDQILGPLVVLAFGQFPAYGTLLAIATFRSVKSLRATSIGTAVVHLLAALACFSGLLPNFS